MEAQVLEIKNSEYVSFAEEQANRLCDVTRVKLDFPKPGVNFLDFNQAFINPNLTKDLAKAFIGQLSISPDDVILAPEARGFILAPVISTLAGCPFIPLRKHGKLPDFGGLMHAFYGTEYSEDGLDLDTALGDSLKGRRVIIYDDVLATGGTAEAAAILASYLDPVNISFCFLAEIAALKGRDKIGRYGNTYSLLSF